MKKPMFKIEIITRHEKFEELKEKLNEIGITGMTVYDVHGCGAQRGHTTYYRGLKTEISLNPKVKVDMVVSEIPVETVISAAEEILKTDSFGDGKIFVSEICQVVRVRTGERDWDALQD